MLPEELIALQETPLMRVFPSIARYSPESAEEMQIN